MYELEKVEGIEERNVIIKGTLTKEENKYARFKEITSNNITSTVSENGREIEIKIEKVKLGRQSRLLTTYNSNALITWPRIGMKSISWLKTVPVAHLRVLILLQLAVALPPPKQTKSKSHLMR